MTPSSSSHDAFQRNLAVQRTGGMDRVRRTDVPPAARAGAPRRTRIGASARRAELQPHLAGALHTVSRPSPPSTAVPTKRARPRRRPRRRAVRRRQRPDGPLHAAQIAEAAAAAGQRGRGRGRRPVLDTHAGRVGLLPTGHLCFGAVDRARGDVARTLGRLDDAIECYERAIDVEEAVGARIYANRSRLGLASRAGRARRRRRPRTGRVPRTRGRPRSPRSWARRWSPTRPARLPARPVRRSPDRRIRRRGVS